MTAHLKQRLMTQLPVLLASTVLLGACATTPEPKSKPDATHAQMVENAPLSTEQYALMAQTSTKSINLRVELGGLSANQRLALDQIAGKASWVSGAPMNVEIVSSGHPASVATAHTIEDYLVAHDVEASHVDEVSADAQPADIVTINLVTYKARHYDCNQTWQDLSKTGNNKPYDNFGCAVTSNLAAQIADPRDLAQPAAATSRDAGRKSTVLDKYRKGEVTGAAQDDAAKGTVSNSQ